MKASEARAKAIDAMDRDRDCYNKLQEIYRQIDEAANKGKLSINIQVTYNYQDYVSTKLIADGYRVCKTFERYEISW